MLETTKNRYWLWAALAAVVLILSGCFGTGPPDRDELVQRYPDIEAGSTKPENKEILCPYLRMIDRAGVFAEQASSLIPSGFLTLAAREFGCGIFECGLVAQIASAGQGIPGRVDVENLHEATGIAHECGLTFEKGGTRVSDEVRSATLASLADRADENGRLLYSDLRAVQLGICEDQGVIVSPAGTLEVRLIYAYLGGVDRGYIMHSDVERFLNATMPETITENVITTGLISQVR